MAMSVIDSSLLKFWFWLTPAAPPRSVLRWVEWPIAPVLCWGLFL